MKPDEQDLETKENAPEIYSHYDRVVLGHPFSAIDRDQIIAAYFAKKLGYTDDNVRYTATADVTDSQLNDPQTLVFEGFKQERFGKGYNVKKSNKFHNPLDQEGTAASSFLNAKQDTRNPLWLDLSELRSWLNAKDSNRPDFKSTRLNTSNLDDLDILFHGYKKDMLDSGEVDLQKYMERCFSVLDLTIEYGRSGKILGQDFPEIETQYKRQRQEALNTLQELTKDSDNFQYQPETKVAFLSCTSLENPIEVGGPGVVRRTVKEKFGEEPQVIVIFNNERDETGRTTGTKVYIDYNEYTGESLEDLLEHRLNYLESLFGHGFDTATRRGFGGHRYHVLASPQFLGTKLDENAVHYLLTDFFSTPRYTEKTFPPKAKDFVSLLGSVETFATTQISSPDDQWSVPERVLEITLKNPEGHLAKISISESDLPIYEKVLSSLPVEQRQTWLLQKTDFNEPREIVTLRELEALGKLQKHLSENNPLALLQDLNGINSFSIRKLPIDIRLQILEQISTHPKSISKIYNTQDTQYRVLVKYLPDWLKENPSEHLAARYNYESLPKKIDTTLITSLCDSALQNKDIKTQGIVAASLANILNSENYQKSHQSESFDHFLETVLEFASDPRLEEKIAVDLIKQIDDYLPKAKTHITQISRTYPGLLRGANKVYPHFSQSLSEIGININQLTTDDTVEGVSRSRVTQPDFEAIKNRSDHTTAILIDIGRHTERDLSVAGYYPWGAKEITPYQGIDGRVVVQGSIDGTRNFESPDNVQLVARKAVAMISETARKIDDPDAKIQIILSSGPNQQAIDLVTGLTMEYVMRHITALDLLRMTVIRFNMQTNEYEEVFLIRDQDHREALLEQASQ